MYFTESLHNYKHLAKNIDLRKSALEFVRLYHQVDKHPRTLLPAIKKAFNELTRLEFDNSSGATL